MTSQRLYAILRKVGIVRAILRGDDWSPGAYVERVGGHLRVTYKVYGIGGEERKLNAMRNYIIPALQAAGIQGAVSEDGLTYRVEE